MAIPGYYAVGQHWVSTSAGSDQLGSCFCAGTLIMTSLGEDRVEDLAVGDHVLTASGASRPVVCINKRSYPQRVVAATPGLQPIRIGAGSLGNRLPKRDLLVSRDQAMLVDGVLVPAFHLTNGVTITVDGQARRVHYVHVETAGHDLLLAEGTAAETFAGEREPIRTPKVEHGYALEAIRSRLAGLAGSAEIPA